MTDATTRQGGEEPNLTLLLLRAGAALAREWKFLLFGGMIFIGLAAVGIILIPLQFDGKATVLFVNAKSPSGTGTMSLLKEAGLGNLLGQDGPDYDQASTLLESEKLAFRAFRKFKLDTMWRDSTAKDSLKPEEIIRNWSQAFRYELTEKSALVISFRSKSPALSTEIANDVCFWLDSMTRAIHQDQTRQNLTFIEEQLAIQTAAFDTAQTRLVAFQRKNRIIALPEQIQASVEGSAKLESEALMADIRARTAANTGGIESSEAKRWSDYRDQLRHEARKIISDPRSSGAIKGIDHDMEKLVDLGRLQREVLARKTIFTFLSQQREQLILDSRKALPTLFVLDHPFIPKRRASPPRRPLLYIAVILWVIGASSWVIARDVIRRQAWSGEELESIAAILGLLPIKPLRRTLLRDFGIEDGHK